MPLERLRELVRKEAGNDWNLHIKIVVKYARELARKEGVDENITEMAALLHDIGRIRFGGENHEITGVPEAEKTLKELGCSKEVIEEVKHCVATHRASKNNPPKTKIAEIIRDADAISHLDIIPGLIQVGLRKNDNDIKKATEWVEAKIDRDWNNKMHLAESKKLAEKKYLAAKLILRANAACYEEE